MIDRKNQVSYFSEKQNRAKSLILYTILESGGHGYIMEGKRKIFGNYFSEKQKVYFSLLLSNFSEFDVFCI